MIYIYGDSHAWDSFKNLKRQNTNLFSNGITLFRVGRDCAIPNFDNNAHDTDSILCFVYGEIDCRCHIHRQIMLGRDEDDIIDQLATNYLQSIKKNVKIYKKIIVVGVIPPTDKDEYEKVHGPIRHQHPFCGTDEERVRFTSKLNKLIREYCSIHGFEYFNPYSYYTMDNGTLIRKLSDGTVHLGDNSIFLDEFEKFCEKLGL